MRNLLVACLLLFFPINVFSAIKTWDGGGATNNWSEAANWSDNTVPGVADQAVFDGTSTKNATIDVNVSVSDFQINTGYTGTISRGSSNLSIGSGGYSQAAGTVTGGGGTIDIDGPFELTGGTFTGSAWSMADVTITRTAVKPAL